MPPWGKGGCYKKEVSCWTSEIIQVSSKFKTNPSLTKNNHTKSFLLNAKYPQINKIMPSTSG